MSGNIVFSLVSSSPDELDAQSMCYSVIFMGEAINSGSTIYIARSLDRRHHTEKETAIINDTKRRQVMVAFIINDDVSPSALVW
jgi:hypothetical protein